MSIGRPRSFDRDEALERATTVFWEHGYDATSIAQLTASLGIGAPSLYAAFGDKRSLFLEALEHYLSTYAAFTQRTLAEERHARDAVERLLSEAAAAYTRPDRPPGCLLITAATNCSPQSADIAAHLRERRAAGAHLLKAKIAEAVQAEELPPSTDPAALTSFYGAVMQGMSAQARDGATTGDLRRIAERAMAAWPESAAPESSATTAR